jgi:N4-gp56 family major capsid protein
MANFTWQFDAPSGAYKQHEVSQQVLRAAIADTVFMEQARIRPGLGKRKGESVTLPRTSALTEQTTYVISETQDIPEHVFAMSAIDLVVQEIGSAVPYTGFSADMNMIDLEDGIRDALTDEMSLALDSLAAAACKLGKIKYAITGAATNNITTNGTFGATSTANMNVFHAEEISDYLYDTLKAKPAVGSDYVGVFRQRSMRGIMRDPAWETWHQYTDPSAKYNGEVGRLDKIRFIPTNHSNALANVGTGSVLGEGIVLGKGALAFTEAITPELYASLPKGHAGRFRAVSWYGAVRFRLAWEDSANAGEANVIHIGSA